MGILLAAAMATALSLALIGGFSARRMSRDERRLLTILVLLELPMSPLLFYGIRVPFEGLLEQWTVPATLVQLLGTWWRPIMEELTKLWPLLLPFVRRSMSPTNRIGRALALGLGFGIGELWMLTEIVYRTDPTTANLSVMTLTGFVNERSMVCLIHGALTAVAIRWGSRGVPIAIGIHYLGNLPFHLRDIHAFGISAATWAVLLRAWVVWYFVALLSLVWKLAGGDFHLVWLLFGDATCPNCGAVYPRATINWRLTVVHQDHCPHCKTRHVE
jgi:hypothetical protein